MEGGPRGLPKIKLQSIGKTRVRLTFAKRHPTFFNENLTKWKT
jgi:hypothetical protein